jgi:multidrug efflux pump subunit AcrB
LRLDLALPASAAAEHVGQVQKACESLLSKTPGVKDVLTLSGPPFCSAVNETSFLISLAADRRSVSRQALIDKLRTQVGQEVREATVRLCDLTRTSRFPRGSYPLHLMIEDRSDAGTDVLCQIAEKLADRLRTNPKLTDVWIGPSGHKQEQLDVDVDRVALQKAGVRLNDVFFALESVFLAPLANDANRASRPWSLRIEKAGQKVVDIKKLKVRNARRELVSVGDLVKVSKVNGPVLVERFNLYPAVEITANIAAGISLSDARKLCERQLEEVRKELRLPNGLVLEWLFDPSAPQN